MTTKFTTTTGNKTTMKHQSNSKGIEEKKIKNLLAHTKHWNGGAGLILSPYIAKLLRAMGFKENYTEDKSMKL